MLWLIWPTHKYKLYSRTDIPFSVWSYACGSDLICLTSPKIWSAYSRTARDVFMKANTGGSQTCRRHRSGRIQVPSETTVSAPSSPHYADLRRDLRYLRQYHRYSRRIPQPFGQDLITSVATHTSMHITVNIRPPHSHYERLSHRDIARVMWQWRKPVFPKAKSESSSIFGDPNRSGWIQPLLCVVCKQPIRHASWNGIYPPIGDKPPLNLPPRGQGSRVNTPIFPVL